MSTACLHVQNRIFEGELLSSQSKQIKQLSKSSDWLEKAGPPKKPRCFGHVNRLKINGISTKQRQIYLSCI